MKEKQQRRGVVINKGILAEREREERRRRGEGREKFDRKLYRQ